MRKMQKIKVLDLLTIRMEQSILELQPRVRHLQGQHTREYLAILEVITASIGFEMYLQSLSSCPLTTCCPPC